MPDLTFILPKGSERTLEVPLGANVMRTARAEDIEGIVAECGGSAMCATCHVYVHDDFAASLPAISDIENEMLECTVAERRPTSRLSCQLSVPAAGLVVYVPAEQQ